MRGTTAKRLRKLAKHELLKLAIQHKMKDPALLSRHLHGLYKNLKRAWKLQSKPKSLDSLKSTPWQKLGNVS